VEDGNRRKPVRAALLSDDDVAGMEALARTAARRDAG
jgi:hypothetical protein